MTIELNTIRLLRLMWLLLGEVDPITLTNEENHQIKLWRSQIKSELNDSRPADEVIV